MPEATVAERLERLGDGFKNQDELGRSILVTAEAEGSISHARARELTNRHSRDVTLKLQELMRRGYLESDGKSRGTTYRSRPGESLRPANQGFGQSPENLKQSLGQSAPGSGQSSGQSSRPRAWLPAGEQNNALLAFCADAWRTLPEIAEALSRAEETVRKHYLPPLLERGTLERRFPHSPRHPQPVPASACAHSIQSGRSDAARTKRPGERGFPDLAGPEEQDALLGLPNALSNLPGYHVGHLQRN